MKHFLKLSCLLWVLIFAAPSLAKSWQNVFPLQTTRAEVVNLFGIPKTNSKDKSEYFVVDNQTVTFRWTRADCFDENATLDEKFVRPDSLVYQITIELDTPLQSIDFYTSDIPKIASPIPGFYIHPYLTNCIGNRSGQSSCSSVSSTYGFGYSNSNRGFTALYFFPTSEELRTWKEKLKYCPAG